MKNALILHGTDATVKDNWFPWLESKLKKRGYKVWVPGLPRSGKPSMKRYNKFILSNNWKFDKDSVIIGHSSGAVAILGILQTAPKEVVIDTCIFVGVFTGDLGWDPLSELWDVPINYKKIKKQARKFVFLHSYDDPYCPLEHAKELSRELDGELIIEKGAQHFSIDPGGPRFRKLPKILNILAKDE